MIAPFNVRDIELGHPRADRCRVQRYTGLEVSFRGQG